MKKKILSLAVIVSLNLFSIQGFCATDTKLFSESIQDNQLSKGTYKVLKSKIKKATIERIGKMDFEKKFGNNERIPKSNEEVIKLAKKLYSKEGREEIQECGESAYGELYAALSNEDITEETIDKVGEIADADMPSLPSIYTSGHFRFHYTTNDTDTNNNVALAEIQSTATVLNNAWNDYASNFVEPKNYLLNGVKMVDVYVYYLGSGLYGQTSSSWNYIELNSKSVVKDSLKRQTTPVHELFHRVQYSYGYVSGTAGMSWAVEGTASWSQKYRASNVGDWMQRINQGLGNTDTSLFTRSYDACFYWCYIGQKTTGGAYGGSESNFVKQCWSTYSTNGKNMKNAVSSAIASIIGSGFTFDSTAGWWMFANYYKDLTNASSVFDYQEDEWIRNTYGPLSHISTTTSTLTLNGNYSTNGSVTAYGADYYVFNIPSNVDRVEISSTGASSNFGYAVIQMKSGSMVTYQRTPAGGTSSLSYQKEFTAGTVDKIAVIVMGNPSGGTYSLNAKGLHKSIITNDANESTVSDNRDFKQLTLKSYGTSLNADISFYSTPTIDGFFFYIDTDGVTGADVCVYCYSGSYKVYKATSPGYYSNLVYTGTPTLSGTNYSISIPWSTSFGTASQLGVWLYDMNGKDRLMDSGSIVVQK